MGDLVGNQRFFLILMNHYTIHKSCETIEENVFESEEEGLIVREQVCFSTVDTKLYFLKEIKIAMTDMSVKLNLVFSRSGTAKVRRHHFVMSARVSGTYETYH